MSQKPTQTRFVVLPDSRRLLLGIDGADCFEPGIVYQAMEIDGEIILRKMGPTLATEPGAGHVSTDPNQIIAAGRHLQIMSDEHLAKSEQKTDGCIWHHEIIEAYNSYMKEKEAVLQFQVGFSVAPGTSKTTIAEVLREIAASIEQGYPAIGPPESATGTVAVLDNQQTAEYQFLMTLTP